MTCSVGDLGGLRSAAVRPDRAMAGRPGEVMLVLHPGDLEVQLRSSVETGGEKMTSAATTRSEQPVETDEEPLTAVAHFTPAERAARGTAARAEVPRKVHGEWEPSPIRADPVELLEDQARSRVPELVPIRYGRMLVSPFTFYRGAAYVMAADLAGTPRTGLHCSFAATHTSRTSASSPPPTGGSSSHQ
jgi:hypothetical protein